MFSLIRVLIERLKALFLSHALVDLEADLIALGARRQASLLRQADQFEEGGLSSIALRVREQAAMLAVDRPLASVKAALSHLTEQIGAAPAELAASLPAEPEAIAPQPRKKKPRPSSTSP